MRHPHGPLVSADIDPLAVAGILVEASSAGGLAIASHSSPGQGRSVAGSIAPE
jgi:hypothetical protein